MMGLRFRDILGERMDILTNYPGKREYSDVV
jgi:hypothetical protein